MVILQALGINNIDCIKKFRNFLLPYTECIQCGIHFTNVDSTLCKSNINHSYVLNRNLILSILQQFLNTINQPNHSIDDVKHKNVINNRNSIKQIDKYFSKLLHLNDIEHFWQLYKEYLSNEHSVIWNIIENGLNEYFLLLKKRKQLDNDCAFIYRQNIELKHLLKQCKQI